MRMATTMRTGIPQLCEWWMLDGPSDRLVLRADDEVVARLSVDDAEGRATLTVGDHRIAIDGDAGLVAREGSRVLARMTLGRGRRGRVQLASGTEARWYSPGFLADEAGFESNGGQRLVRFASDGSAIGYGDVAADLDLVLLLALGHLLLRRSGR